MKSTLQHFSTQMFFPSVNLAKYTLNYNEPWQHRFPTNEDCVESFDLNPPIALNVNTFDTWDHCLVVILLIYGQNSTWLFLLSFFHERATKRSIMSNLKMHFAGSVAFSLSLFSTTQITRFPKGMHCCPHLYFTAVCSLQKLKMGYSSCSLSCEYKYVVSIVHWRKQCYLNQ